MKKTNSNLITLNVVFVVCLIVANVVTAKVIDTGLSISGTSLLIPGAALTYAMTLLGQYLLKAGLAVLDTPFFYLFTRNKTN